MMADGNGGTMTAHTGEHGAPFDAMFDAIDMAEAEALTLHQRGECHLSEWSCSHCEEETRDLPAPTAVRALADHWAAVLDECKMTDPRWILDRSVTTLDTALCELRTALARDEPEAER
jgi:hypothetical protein